MCVVWTPLTHIDLIIRLRHIPVFPVAPVVILPDVAARVTPLSMATVATNNATTRQAKQALWRYNVLIMCSSVTGYDWTTCVYRPRIPIMRLIKPVLR